ncbi:MAG: STAS domain-containing protein [Saprospiraceae bacterium]|nr:STAS domain-containing protein [Saprospiraceae bacterium]
MDENTNYNLTNRDGIHILRVGDLLSELENKKIYRAVEPHLTAEHPDLIVDLSGMDLMNSVGLNFLIQMEKKTESLNGQLILAGVPPKVRDLLRITKLQDIFYQSASVREALGNLVPNR